MPTAQSQALNRLSREKSPYLLQHAENPVDWFPWGDEAFAEAKSRDKPIFLSIGYATCHWCHVMAHESFEDEQAADLINRAFVPVKVDREERPDIDAVYMRTCQLLTGRGGWPLTLFLTPEKEPFFAATYLPKSGRFPQTGLLELIPRVEQFWHNEREKAESSAKEITQHLHRTETGQRGAFPGRDLLQQAVRELSQRFDKEHGGFGSAPKFPAPHNLLFLLGQYRHTHEQDLLFMVESTLKAMRRGGLFDHLGGGFHRYATDREWLLPHFEKMLYDQAMLSLAYLEAFALTGTEVYAETAREVFSYVLRDLRSEQGLFFSGEDADSEGVEGKFYVWTMDEIRDLLSAEEAEAVIQAYHLQEAGNFRDEATKQRTGENILHQLDLSGQKAPDIPEDRFEKTLTQAREKLFNARQKRVRPQLDDKVLTDWNGLMIAALAAGGRILRSDEYTRAAERAADTLLDTMLEPEGGLLHRYKDGQAGIPGFLDDYAFLTWGLLNLYESTEKAPYLQRASRLTNHMLQHFQDPEKGGLFLTADDAETVLMRPREVFDGALPSGNSAAVMNLCRLIAAGENGSLTAALREQIKAFSGVMQGQPTGFTYFLCGVDQALQLISS